MNAADVLSVADIPGLLSQLRQEKFYGRLAFDLRAGEVVLVRTERTQLVSANSECIPHQRENRDGDESRFGPR